MCIGIVLMQRSLTIGSALTLLFKDLTMEGSYMYGDRTGLKLYRDLTVQGSYTMRGS